MDVDDMIISSGGLDTIDSLLSHGNSDIEKLAQRIRDNFFGDSGKLEEEGGGARDTMEFDF